MEFRENLLVDARMLIGLTPIDDGELVTQFALNDRLNHRIKKSSTPQILVIRVEEANDKRLGELQGLQQVNNLRTRSATGLVDRKLIRLTQAWALSRVV